MESHPLQLLSPKRMKIGFSMQDESPFLAKKGMETTEKKRCGCGVQKRSCRQGVSSSSTPSPHQKLSNPKSPKAVQNFLQNSKRSSSRPGGWGEGGKNGNVSGEQGYQTHHRPPIKSSRFEKTEKKKNFSKFEREKLQFPPFPHKRKSRYDHVRYFGLETANYQGARVFLEFSPLFISFLPLPLSSTRFNKNPPPLNPLSCRKGAIRSLKKRSPQKRGGFFSLKEKKIKRIKESLVSKNLKKRGRRKRRSNGSVLKILKTIWDS